MGIIKMFYSDKNQILKTNDDEIEEFIYNCSPDELKDFSNELMNLSAQFSAKLKRFSSLISEKQRDLNSFNNIKGRHKTITPPSGVVAPPKRRGNYTNSDITYDNRGYVFLRTLVICSVVATLILYAILIVNNL